MKSLLNFTILSLLVIQLLPTAIADTEISKSESKPLFMFALGAGSGQFQNDVLTLNDIPTVIYFSDRPDRIAGHLTLGKLVLLWDKGKDSFKANAPNATLSIATESGEEVAVVELLKPRIQGNGVSFNIRLVEGEIPKSFGKAALFIDPMDLDVMML